MNRYYVIDTETTCATPERGVCDIAILELDSDMVIVARHESLIDPQRPIHPEASAIHGLSNSDVADAPTMAEYFSDVAPQCFGGLLQGPAVLIGHNVRFDTHTIGPYVQGSYVELDTLRWFRHLYPQAENHKLQTAVQALGLPVFRMPSGAGHDAMKLHEIMPQAMLFVRGENAGISHNPLESTSAEDMALAVHAMQHLLDGMARDTLSQS